VGFEKYWSEFGAVHLFHFLSRMFLARFCVVGAFCALSFSLCRLMVNMSRNEACCGSNPLPYVSAFFHPSFFESNRNWQQEALRYPDALGTHNGRDFEF